MQIRKLLPYIAQGVIAGIAAGALVALLIWGRPGGEHDVNVEFSEAPRSEISSDGGQAPFSYADAVRTAAPAVVNIHTTKTVARQSHPFFDDPTFRRFFGDRLPREQRQTSLGSGVIISDDGFLVTNNHVVEGADEIMLTLHDGRTVQATMIGTDPETDLAVLKIAAGDLQGIVLGHSDTLQVGDVVLAIGNPFGVGQTVTQGIVSATERSQLGLSTFENFIQTDAAINPGNSGGALINPHGELIGINTAIFSRSGGSEGIGFAIPVNLVKEVMTQLIRSGEVTRSWLGIEIQTLTPELAESFGIRDSKGALIARILKDGPADKAGFETGDIIVEVDGEAISDVREALRRISSRIPGSQIAVRIIRNGKTMTLQPTVAQRPKPATEEQ